MKNFWKPVLARCAQVVCAVCLVGVAGCGRSGEQLLDDGLEAFKTGDHDTAVVLLEKAAAALPADATVHCNLGVAYWLQGRHDDAAKALRKAADYDPSSALPLELLVQVHAEAGQLEPARRAFDEAQQERASPSPRVLTAMAVVERDAGDRVLARDYLVQALDLDPDYAPALYNMASLAKGREDGRTEAEDYFKRFLAQKDSGPRATAVRDFLNPKPDVPDNGGTAGGAPDDTGSNEVDELIVDARKAIGNENLDEALVLLKKAVERDPAHRDALWELVLLYAVGLKDKDRADQHLELFMKRFPDDPMSRGRSPAGTARDPEASRKAFSAGLACYRNRDWAGAIKQYQNALRLNSSSHDAAYNLGLAYKAKGELEKARNEFLYTLRVKPDMADAAYMLALVYRTLGTPSKAIQHLETLLRQTPDYTKAHLLLGYVCQDQREYAKARTHFKRYVELAPPNDPSATKLKQWLRKN